MMDFATGVWKEIMGPWREFEAFDRGKFQTANPGNLHEKGKGSLPPGPNFVPSGVGSPMGASCPP